MKTCSILLFCLFLSLAGFSNDTYQKMMSQTIVQLFQAKTIPEYIEAANQFERISQIEKNEWYPDYYAAFAYIMISFRETENAKKDQYLDQAQKFLDLAMAIEPNESELYMLQGFLYPSRINVDPMSRGMLYMGKMNEALDKALTLNPDNPRVYYLRAIKFNIFKPKNELSPNWGKEMNEAEMKNAEVNN